MFLNWKDFKILFDKRWVFLKYELNLYSDSEILNKNLKKKPDIKGKINKNDRNLHTIFYSPQKYSE